MCEMKMAREALHDFSQFANEAWLCLPLFLRRAFSALAVICVCLLLTSAITRDIGLGPSIRMIATADALKITAADLPAPIYNEGSGARVWSLRARADGAIINPALAEAAQLAKDAPLLTALALNGAPDIDFARLAPLLSQDGVSAPELFASVPHGDHLDASGKPLRWHLAKSAVAAYSVKRPTPFPEPAAFRRPLNPRFEQALAKLAPAANARHYVNLVESFSRQYNLDTALVMAIIHSESNFSPRIVSGKSAMGLMQLLPSTASDEVHRFLYGRKGNVGFEQLANPETNIRYGAAYLRILYDRYFFAVKDRLARELCVIASYNLGPNRFLRLYGASNEEAVAKINSMSTDEFHADLPRRLPVQETRFYVEKVKRMKRHYASLR